MSSVNKVRMMLQEKRKKKTCFSGCFGGRPKDRQQGH